MSPEEQLNELVRRMNAKDLAGTLELIADDAVYFWSNGASLVGKAAIAEGLRRNFQDIRNDTFETLDVTWILRLENVAACIYEFRWTGDIDGRPAGGGGRGSSMLRKINDDWRIVHEHLSAGAWKPVTAI